MINFDLDWTSEADDYPPAAQDGSWGYKEMSEAFDFVFRSGSDVQVNWAKPNKKTVLRGEITKNQKPEIRFVAQEAKDYLKEQARLKDMIISVEKALSEAGSVWTYSLYGMTKQWAQKEGIDVVRGWRPLVTKETPGFNKNQFYSWLKRRNEMRKWGMSFEELKELDENFAFGKKTATTRWASLNHIEVRYIHEMDACNPVPYFDREMAEGVIKAHQQIAETHYTRQQVGDVLKKRWGNDIGMIDDLLDPNKITWFHLQVHTARKPTMFVNKAQIDALWREMAA